jgi:hypothetical protein
MVSGSKGLANVADDGGRQRGTLEFVEMEELCASTSLLTCGRTETGTILPPGQPRRGTKSVTGSSTA